ncbi:hypothetical protein NPIL_74431 [Nephila pilipes]|uniref:Uncharacterized protein n=1 Tax=Nephila pilipes TaxID=299642 RepID=A0A8X6PWA8_NEPPI|nr:hypothetical protein NPIL_74431 [Nephila pilipes]
MREISWRAFSVCLLGVPDKTGVVFLRPGYKLCRGQWEGDADSFIPSSVFYYFAASFLEEALFLGGGDMCVKPLASRSPRNVSITLESVEYHCYVVE